MIPRSKLKSYGDRAFSVFASKLWNDIPKFNVVKILTLLSVILKLIFLSVILMNDHVQLLFLTFSP